MFLILFEQTAKLQFFFISVKTKVSYFYIVLNIYVIILLYLLDFTFLRSNIRDDWHFESSSHLKESIQHRKSYQSINPKNPSPVDAYNNNTALTEIE